MLAKRIIDILYRSRDSLTLKEALCIASNNNVIFLDVRSKQEYNEGHLTGAVNIPIYELEKNVEKVLKDKNHIIIVYCSAGIRSKRAIEDLKTLGYKNVYHIYNGIV